MSDDKPENKTPQNPGTCIVSTNSRVREPGEKPNGTLTSTGYEMEIVRARERALDAQRIAEEATRQAGANQSAKVIQTIRYKKGAPPEVVYLSLAVEQASAEIQESVRQARFCMLEALEAASVEFSRMLDREIRQTMERAKEDLACALSENAGKTKKEPGP
ncbi:MAG: hypothetical protein JEZ02_04750 [Desulfatibacillum sp.]|nr:hypothetical protein [Desulfatibacillum sp.]